MRAIRRDRWLCLTLVAAGCAPGPGGTPSPTGGQDGGVDEGGAADVGSTRDGAGRLDDAGHADAGAASASDGATELRRCDQVVAVVRDFRGYDLGGHPDFENVNENEPDWELGPDGPSWPHAVEPYLDTELAEDGTPRYTATGPSPSGTIQGPETFADWYHDSDRNMRFEVTLRDMDPSAERFVFDDDEFFPIDGKGYGDNHSPVDDPSIRHNYHFTTEIAAEFEYRGGETFTFSGDDDVWLFVNGKLALDLGGHHEREDATVDFDALAGYLGIEVGGTYTLRLFHAERHTSESHFRLETSIACLDLI